MEFKEKLESLTKKMVEVSDPKGINIEWYESVSFWNDYLWSMVRNYDYSSGESVAIRKNVDTLKARVLDLSDEASLKRFRDAGSRLSCFNIGLWKLKEFLDGGDYTHVFIEGIGELDAAQIAELKEWLADKVC